MGGKQASRRSAIFLSISPEPQDHHTPINEAPPGLPPSDRKMLPASKRKEALPISEPCVGSQHKRGMRSCCPDGSKLQQVQGTGRSKGLGHLQVIPTRNVSSAHTVFSSFLSPRQNAKLPSVPRLQAHQELPDSRCPTFLTSVHRHRFQSPTGYTSCYSYTVCGAGKGTRFSF